MNNTYSILVKYGTLLADKEHHTTEGNLIRFTTYKLNNEYYVVTKFNNNVIMIAQKEDLKDMCERCNL